MGALSEFADEITKGAAQLMRSQRDRPVVITDAPTNARQITESLRGGDGQGDGGDSQESAEQLIRAIQGILSQSLDDRVSSLTTQRKQVVQDQISRAESEGLQTAAEALQAAGRDLQAAAATPPPLPPGTGSQVSDAGGGGGGDDDGGDGGPPSGGGRGGRQGREPNKRRWSEAMGVNFAKSLLRTGMVVAPIFALKKFTGWLMSSNQQLISSNKAMGAFNTQIAQAAMGLNAAELQHKIRVAAMAAESTAENLYAQSELLRGGARFDASMKDIENWWDRTKTEMKTDLKEFASRTFSMGPMEKIVQDLQARARGEEPTASGRRIWRDIEKEAREDVARGKADPAILEFLAKRREAMAAESQAFLEALGNDWVRKYGEYNDGVAPNAFMERMLESINRNTLKNQPGKVIPPKVD